MTASSRVKAPVGLQEAGSALWATLTAELDFDAAESVILAAACRQADDIAALELLLVEQGSTVVGSTGQQRLNPAFGEVRQARLALGKLVGQLAIPLDSDQPMTSAQRRAQKAAQSRWGTRGTA